MTSIFKCDAKTFKYKKTRKGIDAVCPITDLEGNLVATLHDSASAIVAQVEFYHTETSMLFLREARENLNKDSWVHSANLPSDAAWVSEYARQITMAAEDALI